MVQTESGQSIKTLIDTTNKHLRTLTVNKVPVEHWDAFKNMVTTCLPFEVRKACELSELASHINLPTWDQLEMHLEAGKQAINAAHC